MSKFTRKAYEEEIDNIFDRYEQDTKQPPTQKNIEEWISERHNKPITQKQRNIVKLMLSRNLRRETTSHTRKGKPIKSYRKSHVSWKHDETEYLTSHTLKESRIMFSSQHTSRGIYDKWRRSNKIRK